MALRVQCPNGCVMRVPSNRAGMSARCPGCKAVVVIPFPPVDHQTNDLLEAVLSSSASSESSGEPVDQVASPTEKIQESSQSSASTQELPVDTESSSSETKEKKPPAGDNARSEQVESRQVKSKSSANRNPKSKEPAKPKAKKSVKSVEVGGIEAGNQTAAKDTTKPQKHRVSTPKSDDSNRHKKKKASKTELTVPKRESEKPNKVDSRQSEPRRSREREQASSSRAPVSPHKSRDSVPRKQKSLARELPAPPVPKAKPAPNPKPKEVAPFRSTVDDSTETAVDFHLNVADAASSGTTVKELPKLMIDAGSSMSVDEVPEFGGLASSVAASPTEFSLGGTKEPAKSVSPSGTVESNSILAMEKRTRRANADRITLTRFFAAMLVFVGVVNFTPAIYCWYTWSQNDIDFMLPRWIYLQIFIAVLHVVYAILLIQVPDWSTLRSIAVVMLAFAFVFGLFSMGLLTTGSGGMLAQFLQVPDSMGRQACIWCVAMLCLATLASYLAGRESSAWQRTEKLLAEILSRKDAVTP